MEAVHILAGDEGFEPPNARTRTWCLTTWRIPNIWLIYLDDYTTTDMMPQVLRRGSSRATITAQAVIAATASTSHQESVV